MKIISTFRFTLLALPVLLTLDLQPPTAFAQGTAFTYQGRLQNNGSPASGTYDLTFTLFNTNNSGVAIAGPVTNTAMAVSNGLFTATIDFGPGVLLGSSNWLEIAVQTKGGNGFITLSPRQPITPVPYSIYSGNSAHADTAAQADQASSILSGTISAPQLNTLGVPGPGQVLGYNGSQLVWQDPVIGGSTGGWSLTGNTGTTPGVNFVGTTDNQPLEFYVNSTRALRLEPTGSAYPNVIGGGPSNLASNGVTGVVVGGGINNVGGGNQSFVGGGYQNSALGYITTVGGGAYNTANGTEAAVLGGAYNFASGAESVVAGGYNNIATNFSAVGGGYDNLASGIGAAVSGGGYDGSTVLGNGATGPVSFIGGGMGNAASGYGAAIEGGEVNTASGNDLVPYYQGQFLNYLIGDSTVGGGHQNVAGATGATVPGGAFNTASGDLSFAAGFHASAVNYGTFVWADESSSSSFSSSAANQFIIRAAGGVGIGTNSTPRGGLRIASGGLAVTGASSPNYGTAAGVFLEKFGTTAGAIFAYDYNVATPLSLALNSPGGNVGIGTLSPQYTLDVNGTTRTHSIIITGGADLAEPFKMGGDQIPQGSVVIIDEAHPGQLKLSASAYDTRVAGIVSGAHGIHPGIALQQEGELGGGQNVALSGRVYVLADATPGAIRPGDLLTTSNRPGHAMKVADPARAQGAILGKAMSGLSEGTGMVLVLVTLQ